MHLFTCLYIYQIMYQQGLIRWIQSTEIGGFETSNITIDFAVVIFDSSEYIDLCCKSVDNVTFSDLGSRIDKILKNVLRDCPKSTRLSLLFIDLQGALNQHVSNKSQFIN